MVDKTLDRINKYIPSKWQWILNHSGFRKYFKNTGWMFGGQILYLLLSFFIGAWIARYLGPEKYGTVSYVVAFVGLFSFISSMGIDGILKRELVNTPERHNELMGTSFRLKLFGSIIAILTVILFTIFIPGNSYLSKLLIIIFSFNFLFQVPFVLNNHFYAQVKAKNAVKSQFFSAIISSILKIILILSGKGIIWLILIYTFDSIWHSLFIVYYYKKDRNHFTKWKYSKEVAKQIWRESWPLMLSTAAVTIYYRIDQVMVGKMMGDFEVGIYAASVKLTEIFNFIPGLIIGSLFPAIVNSRKMSKNDYRKRLKSLYFLIITISLIISITVYLLAKPFVQIVYGNGYLLSISILQLYIWSSIGMFISHVVDAQLVTENKTRLIFKLNIFTMTLNIILNIILIPKIGLIGAALSTLISFSVYLLWVFYKLILKR